MRKAFVGFMVGLLAFASMDPAQAAKPDKPAHASRLETVMTTRVDGNLVIDPDGKVDEVTFVTPVDPSIKDLLDRRIREWQFRPVLIDGVARRVTSSMRVTLAASQRANADGFLVWVDNVIFPDGAEPAHKSNAGFEVDTRTALIRVRSMAPPVYPSNLLMLGVPGKVLLGLRISADGRVEAVQVIQTQLLGVRGYDRALEAAIRDFERAAVSKARHWRFDVTAKAAALDPRDMTHVVPVIFEIRGKESEPVKIWRTVVRTPKQALSWLAPVMGVNLPGVADVGGGESLPVASRLQLAQDVVGAVL
jgi:hypothetical protein